MLSLHQLALSFGSFARDEPDILEKPAPPMCQGLKATNFVPYFNYLGNLTNVEGVLTIYPHPDKSRMLGLGQLSGIDPMCSSGPNTGLSANSCGVHIHKGTSCTEDAEGHYYDTYSIGSDPWGAGYYAADSDGTADVAFALIAGTSSADITGKAVIVHDYNGGRIGCALLEMPMAAQVAAPFGNYFDAAKDLNDTAKQMSGVQIYTTPDNTAIDYVLFDVDPACAAGPDTTINPNSCGIHIHEGSSCSDDALGHYYDKTSIDPDPWGAGYYEAGVDADMGVFAAGSFSLKAGLSQADITGKTLIVHNHAGDRTHCAPIHAPKGYLGVGDFTACPPAAEVGCPLGVALSMPVECLGDDGSWLG